MQPLLQLNNIYYTFHSMQGETEALSNVSFEVKKNEFLAIVGPSGCGKSTLLSVISNLIKPDEGKIIFNGNNIGYMFQKDNLFEWRTIYNNILLGLEINKLKTEDNLLYIDNLLKKYGLYEFKDAKPSELSGGMRQRAALIRTLALKPDLLLLDEPFSALDYQTRLNVSNDISGIIKREKKTAILVTHDLSEAISLSDRVIVLSKRPGKVKKIIDINFDLGDKRNVFNSRNSPEFKDYFNTIWKELNY